MIARKILLFFGLCLALVASIAAPSQPATQTDIQQLQQQILVLDKELTVLKEVASNRLDAQDKRVGDLGLWTSQQANHMGAISNLSTLVGIGITVLTALIAVGAGFITYFSTKNRVIEEAEKHAQSAAEAWFIKNKEKLEKEIAELEELAANGKTTINTRLSEIDQAADQILSRPNHSPSQASNPEALLILKTASSALKSKPETEFTAEDHYIRGLNEYSAKRFDLALTNFDTAISIATTESVPPEKLSDYMFARALTLGDLNRHDEEIKGYDKIDEYFGKYSDPTLRRLVGKSLFNKGFALSQLNRSQDEIKVYDEIERRYSSDNTPPLRELTANALVNKGITLKQLNRPEEAIETLERAEKRYANDDNPEMQYILMHAREHLREIKENKKK